LTGREAGGVGGEIPFEAVDEGEGRAEARAMAGDTPPGPAVFWTTSRNGPGTVVKP
jgi:hypothetical protein